MGQQVLVHAGGAEFWAEVAEADGPRTVALDDVLSFDGVRDTVKAIGEHLVTAWEHVKPTEASVEFALALTAKNGVLTGMLVNGTGEASLRVTLTWSRQPAEPEQSAG